MSDNPNYKPTLAGFTTFVRGTMGIPAEFLPDDSPYLAWSLDHALNIVTLDLQHAYAARGAWGPYVLAVYNLGGHLLIEQCPDQMYAISAVMWSGNLVTLTTSATNLITAGVKVAVNGVSAAGATPTGYNGVFVVSGTPNNTQLTYALAPNPGGVVSVVGATVSEQFFFAARRGYKIAGFVPGVVTSTSDQGTSVGLLVPDAFKGLTIMDLQLLRTPYGRAYLSLAQDAGPNCWGLT